MQEEGLSLAHGGASAGDDSSEDYFIPHQGITRSDHHDSHNWAVSDEPDGPPQGVTYSSPPVAAVVLGGPGKAVVHSWAGVVVHEVAFHRYHTAELPPG